MVDVDAVAKRLAQNRFLLNDIDIGAYDDWVALDTTRDTVAIFVKLANDEGVPGTNCEMLAAIWIDGFLTGRRRPS